MDPTTQIINRVLPILFLILLGHWTRRSNFLADSSIDDLRKIAVNLALPAVLFISFLRIEFQAAYLVIFGVMYALCLGLFWLGSFLQRKLNIPHPYFPFLMTGFEYGMLGVSLFGSAYGLEKFVYLAIADLGHEVFIWSFFLLLLLMKRDGVRDPGQVVRAFFKSPVVIAILAGIVLNLAGGQGYLYDLPLTGALVATLEFLSNLLIPLILIIIGYGIKFDRYGLKDAFQVVLLRLVFLIPLAFILSNYLVRDLLQLGKPLQAAIFTLLILPPPFIVPLFMRPELREEKRYVNNVLTVYTVISIAIFTVYFVLNPWI